MGYDAIKPIVIGAAVLLLLQSCGSPPATPTATPPPPTPSPTLTPTSIPPTATSTPTTIPPTATAVPARDTGIGHIGEEGGEIAGPGGARLIVPGSALTETVEIRVEQVPAIPEVPAEYAASLAGPAYEVTVPKGNELQAMVDLVLPLERRAGTSA